MTKNYLLYSESVWYHHFYLVSHHQLLFGYRVCHSWNTTSGNIHLIKNHNSWIVLCKTYSCWQYMIASPILSYGIGYILKTKLQEWAEVLLKVRNAKRQVYTFDMANTINLCRQQLNYTTWSFINTFFLSFLSLSVQNKQTKSWLCTSTVL